MGRIKRDLPELDEIDKIIGRNLRKIRKLRGMTQYELSEPLNQGRYFASKVECGRKRLQLAEAIILCRELDLSITDFVEIIKEDL